MPKDKEWSPSGLNSKVLAAIAGIAIAFSFSAVTYLSFRCDSCKPKEFRTQEKAYIENTVLSSKLEALIRKYDDRQYAKGRQLSEFESKYGVSFHGIKPYADELSSLELALKAAPNRVKPLSFYILPAEEMGKNEDGRPSFMVTVDAKVICIARHSVETISAEELAAYKHDYSNGARHELAHSWHRKLIRENSAFSEKWDAAKKWHYSGSSKTFWINPEATFKMAPTANSGMEATKAKWGFISPYGSKDIMEDAATFVQETHKIAYGIFPPGFTAYESSKDEITEKLTAESQLFTIDYSNLNELDIYKAKFSLLRQYGFISEKEHEEVKKWMELAPKLGSLSDEEISLLEKGNYEKGLKLISSGMADKAVMERVKGYEVEGSKIYKAQ